MPTAQVIGIVSPGAMGSALGRAWAGAGARVVATVAGRSERTRSLATGLELLPGLVDVVAASDVVVSVVPPHRAVATAAAIAAAAREAGRHPVVADVNAISPQTLAEVAAQLEPVGIRLLDGAISGSPPKPGGDTVLFLAGADADLLDLPGDGLQPKVLGREVGRASAVKMSTAAIYKGFTALLIQSLQTARANGVVEPVLEDLRIEFGAVLDDVATRIAIAGAKSDRFPGEMRQIAQTQEAAGAGRAVYDAIAEVYERVALTSLGRHTPEQAKDLTDLGEVLDQLAGPATS